MVQTIKNIVLVGASAASEISCRQWLGREKYRNAQVTQGFGSFPAAFAHFGAAGFPDAILIENWTCMAKSDIENGCAKLGRLIEVAVAEGKDPPLVIIEDDTVYSCSEELVKSSARVFYGWIQDVLPLK